MNGLPGVLSGVQVIRSQYAVTRVQVRFPRSKKRRICKKWQKDQRNYGFMPGMFKIGGVVVCHPKVWDKLVHAGTVVGETV